MKINISFDTDRITKFVDRVGKGKLFAGVAMLSLAGASTYAYAVSNTPTHVFTAGSPISASDVNENFSELFSAANVAESDIATLQSDVAALESGGGGGGINSCTWKYQFSGSSPSDNLCGAGRFALTGSCSAISGSVTNSRPINIAGGAATPVTNGTGWHCATTGGAIDSRVLCCPE